MKNDSCDILFSKTFKFIINIYIVFFLTVLVSCEKGEDLLFYESGVIVDDYISAIKVNGDYLRLLLVREYEHYKSPKLGHTTEMSLKKIEFYVSDVDIPSLLEGKKELVFGKAGELEGDLTLKFTTFFDLSADGSEIILKARGLNSEGVGLCELYSGKCSYEFVSTEKIKTMLKGYFENRNKIVFEGNTHELSITTLGNENKYLTITTDIGKMSEIKYSLSDNTKELDAIILIAK